MAHAVLEQVFGQVIEPTVSMVSPLGFTRRGAILRTFRHGNSGIIEFQKSTKGSSGKLLFTINLAIVCGELLGQDQPDLEKARSVDAHFRQRIGMLLPDRPDKWWEITETTDVNALATEVGNLISKEAAPYIQRYLDTNELIALWKSGKSPGLTETQRVKYLEMLDSKRKSK